MKQHSIELQRHLLRMCAELAKVCGHPVPETFNEMLTEREDMHLVMNFLKGLVPEDFFKGFQIIYNFSGAGDSGDIDDPHLEMLLEYMSPCTNGAQTGEDRPSEGMQFVFVRDLVESLRSELLGHTELVAPYLEDYDWWNNDGGHGMATITLDPLKIHVEYSLANVHYEHEEAEFSLEFEEDA